MQKDDNLTQLQWLVQLRWWAVVGQLIAIAFAHWFFNSQLNLYALLSISGLLILSNIFLATFIKRKSSISRNFVGTVLIFDTALLTLLLYWSGGHMNPFSIFYLLHVTLAALVLGPFWTWITAAVCSLCFGSLFLFEIPGSNCSKRRF